MIILFYLAESYDSAGYWKQSRNFTIHVSWKVRLIHMISNLRFFTIQYMFIWNYYKIQKSKQAKIQYQLLLNQENKSQTTSAHPNITGGHRTRVAAVTLDNMAEDAVAASASLWQILTVSVRYCRPAFVSWLSMLWDTLTRNSELQWFGISSQFRLELSRGDEGVGHVCFPGDEGVGRPWRGYRCVQMNVGPV